MEVEGSVGRGPVAKLTAQLQPCVAAPPQLAPQKIPESGPEPKKNTRVSRLALRTL